MTVGREEGSVHPLLVVTTLFVVAGFMLLHDIGVLVITKWSAMQSADSAAHAAAQALDHGHYLVTGEARLEPARAEHFAAGSVAEHQRIAKVAVDGARATVVVEDPTGPARTLLLRAFRVDLRGSGTARLVRGVSAAEP